MTICTDPSAIYIYTYVTVRGAAIVCFAAAEPMNPDNSDGGRVASSGACLVDLAMQCQIVKFRAAGFFFISKVDWLIAILGFGQGARVRSSDFKVLLPTSNVELHVFLLL